MKHLVDLDEAALAAVQQLLGTTTIKDTVNAALRQVAGREQRQRELTAAFETLASVPILDREEAWR